MAEEAEEEWSFGGGPEEEVGDARMMPLRRCRPGVGWRWEVEAGYSSSPPLSPLTSGVSRCETRISEFLLSPGSPNSPSSSTSEYGFTRCHAEALEGNPPDHVRITTPCGDTAGVREVGLYVVRGPVRDRGVWR